MQVTVLAYPRVRKFTGREREPGERIEEALYLIGRRGGKDRAMSVLASYLAAFVDWSGVLSKGERGVVVCIAPDTKQAKIQRDYIEGVFGASPALARMVTNRTQDTLELSNGITIEVRSASFRRVRGVTAVAVIASECAFWYDESTSSNSDVEILNAVRPSLATTRGPLVMISTPYARRGATWDFYKANFRPHSDPLLLCVQATSTDFNPSLSQKVIERALARDPSAAAAEYLAQFRSDVESFIARELLEAAIDSGVMVRPPRPDISYKCYVDASSGAGQDSFCVTIGHKDKDEIVVDGLTEQRPPFNPNSAIADAAKLMKSYRITSCRGDKYAAGFVIEGFKANGIEYRYSGNDTSQNYLEALPLFTSGRVRLVDNSRLVGQFVGLERKTSPGGRDRIDHPDRQHDDASASCAGLLAMLGAPKFEQKIPMVAPVIISTADATARKPTLSNYSGGGGSWGRLGSD